MIRKVKGIYFSPIGGTAKMTVRLAKEIGARIDDFSPEDVTVECVDMLNLIMSGITADDETVFIIGMPSYVGKIPLPAAEIVRRIKGNGAMALAAVSYGSSSYGNSLFELNRLLEDCGFKTIGAGAFPVRYGSVKKSRGGAGDLVDADSLMAFCKAVSAKIMRLAGSEIEALKIKPMPVEVRGRMPVHKISRISPKAAAAAQSLFNKVSIRRHGSEWFL